MKESKGDKIKLSHDFDAFAEFLETVDHNEESPVVEEKTGSNLRFVHQNGDNVVFVHPQHGHIISVGFLQTLTIEVLDYTKTKDIEIRDLSQFQPLVALPGDILARSTDDGQAADETVSAENVEAVLLEAGANVRIDSRGQYIADQYGFIVLNGKAISILSPLKISHDMLRVDWLVVDEHPAGVDRQMLEFWLSDATVKKQPDNLISDILKRMDEGVLQSGAHTIVRGTPPVHGEDGHIEWFVQVDYIAGKLLPDGRIDFRERNFVVTVSRGQMLARLRRESNGTAGKSIFGRYLPAKNGVPVHLVAGENVRRESEERGAVYYAEKDGAVHVFHNKVMLTEVLTLPNGVNFETGNVDFSGDVIVYGIVESGFTVRAGGDIVVTESVENGALLEAQGNVVVGTSISGRRTSVSAGLSIKAQYINESTLKAGNDIILGSYALHAKLRAIGMIQVNKSTGKHGGAIIGGEAWGSEKIDVYFAGAEAWVQTELIAGIRPEQIERLDELKESIGEKNKHLRQILDYFGLTNIDLNKLKEMIENAEGVARKGMAIRAKYLAKTGKDLQELLAEKAKLVAEIGPAPDNAEILIRESAHPNVTICIGKSRRKLELNVLGPARFQLRNDTLTRV